MEESSRAHRDLYRNEAAVGSDRQMEPKPGASRLASSGHTENDGVCDRLGRRGCRKGNRLVSIGAPQRLKPIASVKN